MKPNAKVSKSLTKGLFLAIGLLFPTTSAFGQGIVLPGVGPINRSMGGAAAAAPIDAAGAIHWNPASITKLQSEMLFGAEFLHTQTEVSSSLPANSFGPGVPPIPLSGSDSSRSGLPVLPTIGLVHNPEGSRVALGLGVFTIGGFGVNYPASQSNPILTAQAPNGFGIGNGSSRLSLIQIAPTVAYKFTDRLSLGFAPTITIGDLSLTPALFAAPDDANGDSFATYPDAVNGRPRYGLGIQVGLFWESGDRWSLGAALKTKQWFEEFEFLSADEVGGPNRFSTNPEYPLILNVGAAYAVDSRTLLAADVRYIDYTNANFFGNAAAFDSQGRVTGLGWDSTLGIAVGCQRTVNQNLSVRVGYNYGENPIADENTAFNVLSPAIWNHAVSTGCTIRLTENLSFSTSYVRVFESQTQGALLSPLGAVPGSTVELAQESDTLAFGFNTKY